MDSVTLRIVQHILHIEKIQAVEPHAYTDRVIFKSYLSFTSRAGGYYFWSVQLKVFRQVQQ